jgi:predicted glycosyltransferase
MLKRRGTRLVLGLRDVVDHPRLLAEDWGQPGVMHALKNQYDQIWVYGLPQICNPFDGVDLPESVAAKVSYTGYLRRGLPEAFTTSADLQASPTPPYIVVTPGGGGDGEILIDWVLRAYENERKIGQNALVVFGPFMADGTKAGFIKRIERLAEVQALTFDTHMEHLLANSTGIITMGGYNTFCEVLTLDKKSIIVPRAAPKIEQYIRGKRAEELGLAKLLSIDGPKHSAVMAQAIRDLPHQPPPSHVNIPGLLDGIDNVNRMVAEIIRERPVQAATF